MIEQPNIEFLEANIDTWHRHKVGNFKYLDDIEAKRYQEIAKEIDSERYFTIYGCDECIKTLIRFVFENYEKQINGQSSEIQAGEKSVTTNSTKPKPRKAN